MWWMLKGRLKKLNDYDVDLDIIDRTLEFSEALNALKRYPAIRTSAGMDDADFMMKEYGEFLEESGAS